MAKTITEKASKLVGNTKKAIQEKLKELGKIVGKRIVEVDKDEQFVLSAKMKKAVQLKSEFDKLQSKIQKIAADYEEARQELLDLLPGEDKDTVEIVLNGVRVLKFPRNTLAGKLDEEKVIELSKTKGIFRKVIKTKVIRKKEVDASALIQAIADGKISYEEYMKCTKQSITPVVELSYVAPVEKEEEVQQAAN